VEKSKLSIALDGPINYQDERRTQHKKEKKNYIIFSSLFFFSGLSWASHVWLGRSEDGKSEQIRII
jgi:hypothetical protein